MKLANGVNGDLIGDRPFDPVVPFSRRIGFSPGRELYNFKATETFLHVKGPAAQAEGSRLTAGITA
jgi:hypothetical protein